MGGITRKMTLGNCGAGLGRKGKKKRVISSGGVGEERGKGGGGAGEETGGLH